MIRYAEQGVDDPTGGVLDQAPDARWFQVFSRHHGSEAECLMLQDVPAREPYQLLRPPSSPGRIVIQAWLASRGLIVAVALVLAVVQHRTLTDMVSNWDVQHFAGWLPADTWPSLMAP